MNDTVHYAVIDTETSGLNPRQHDAIQIAMVLLHGRTLEELARFSSLIRPEHFRADDPTTYDERGLAVTGRTVEDLAYLQKHAPPFREVRPEMERAVFGSGRENDSQTSYGKEIILFGQNVSFDLAFWRQLLVQAGLERDRYGYHSEDLQNYCGIAQKHFGMEIPGAKRNLDAQAEFFKIPRSKEHDALEDCLVTAECLRRYSAMFAMREVAFRSQVSDEAVQGESPSRVIADRMAAHLDPAEPPAAERSERGSQRFSS